MELGTSSCEISIGATMGPVAKEVKIDGGRRVVKARITTWKPRDLEKSLFADVDDLPNWRLADKSRRSLGDLCAHFSEQLPSALNLKKDELKPDISIPWAVIAASGIAVRSAGAAMSMIGCGYLPEAGSAVRRLIEADLNGRQSLDDTSGDYAVRFLRGRSKGITKLAAKYKATDHVELLSTVTHANARALHPLSSGFARGTQDVHENTIHLDPARDEWEAAELLYTVAYECMGMSSMLADAFDVDLEISPWISGELKRSRNILQERRRSQDQ